MSGKGALRLVHGHGTGRLAAAVREFLTSHPGVASFRYADAQRAAPPSRSRGSMSDQSYDINDDVKRDVLARDGPRLAHRRARRRSRRWASRGRASARSTARSRRPSTSIPDKGFYYCFGCGAKGDAITFVRETERLDFPEAVAYLARLAGVTLPCGGAARARTAGGDARLRGARRGRGVLPREPREARGARALLEKRGLTPEEGAALGFGAAPDSWDALRTGARRALHGGGAPRRGTPPEEPGDGPRLRPLPQPAHVEIRDARGEILGFGARAFGDEQPKYLNSPETPRFSKGKLLYGLDRAREAIRREDAVLLVEGYFDRIACERAGLAWAVASMGTALTPAQADLLARQAATVIVAYDGDPPGVAAAYKAFPLLLARGVNVKHLALPDGPRPRLVPRGARRRGAEGRGRRRAAAPRGPPRGHPPAGSDPTERAAKLREAAEILSAAPDPRP